MVGKRQHIENPSLLNSGTAVTCPSVEEDTETQADCEVHRVLGLPAAACTVLRPSAARRAGVTCGFGAASTHPGREAEAGGQALTGACAAHRRGVPVSAGLWHRCQLPSVDVRCERGMLCYTLFLMKIPFHSPIIFCQLRGEIQWYCFQLLLTFCLLLLQNGS